MTDTKSTPTAGEWTIEYDGSLVIGGQTCSAGPIGPDGASREEKLANTRAMSAAKALANALAAMLAEARLYADFDVAAMVAATLALDKAGF